MVANRSAVTALLVGSFVWACSGPPPSWLDADGGDGAGLSGSGPGSGGAGQTGLPCDVANVLATHCVSCHGSPAATGTPISLVTHADLTAASPAGGTIAERCVARMIDSVSPMPPKPASAVPAEEVAILKAWVAAGAPQGDCGGGAAGGGTSPYDTPPTCTTNDYWPAASDEESPDMHPGKACIGCHTQEDEGPDLDLAGTVFATAHEYDDCYGYDGAAHGVKVIVVGKDGQEFSMDVISSGNFFREKAEPPVIFPITAKVVRGSQERVMATEVSTGDCNSCHTLEGAGMPKAPGRIMAP